MARPKKRYEDINIPNPHRKNVYPYDAPPLRTKRVNVAGPIRRKLTIRQKGHGLSGITLKRTELVSDFGKGPIRHYMEPGHPQFGAFDTSTGVTRRVYGFVKDGRVYTPLYSHKVQMEPGHYEWVYGEMYPPGSPDVIRKKIDQTPFRGVYYSDNISHSQYGTPTGRNKASHKAKRKSPKKPSGW